MKNLTGLIWLQIAFCTQTIAGIEKGSGGLPWFDALTWTNGLENGFCGLTYGSTAGFWRVPNRKELESLLDFAYYLPALSSECGNRTVAGRRDQCVHCRGVHQLFRSVLHDHRIKHPAPLF